MIILFFLFFSHCIIAQIINGGFEGGSAGWYYPLGDSVIYDESQINPLQDTHAAFFGGVTFEMEEEAAQDITIPISLYPTYLQFYAYVFFSSTQIGNGFMVSIDSETLLVITASNWNLNYNLYHPIALNITKYADGNEHVISFYAYSADNGETGDRFLVLLDEVSLIHRPYSLFARNVIVAATGNDETGDGTELNPFQSIQMAVWSIANGFSVVIHSGVYVGDVDTSGKTITISGDVDVYVLESRFTCNTLYFSGPTMNIEGIIFAYGNAGQGGSISLGYSSTVFLSFCHFQENIATYGGAIYLHPDAQMQLNSCSFHNNSATRNGGAIFLSTRGLLLVYDSSFSNNFLLNTELYGSVVLIGTAARVTIETTTFNGNGEKALLGQTNSNLDITDCHFERGSIMTIVSFSKVFVSFTTFENNTIINPNNLDALIYMYEGDLTLYHCNIEDNDAYGFASFVFLESSNASISKSVFRRNSVQIVTGFVIGSIQSNSFIADTIFEEHKGEAILQINSGFAKISNCTFTHHWSSKIAVGCFDCQVIVVQSKFYDVNQAVTLISSSLFSTAIVDISGCRFDTVSAVGLVQGIGAFYFIRDSLVIRANFTSYAMSFLNSRGLLNNVTFSNCTASPVISSISSTVSIQSSSFVNNALATSGYVFFAYLSDIQISNSIFSGNDLLSELNSVIFSDSSFLKIKNVQIVNNNVNGILISSTVSSSTLILDSCLFSESTTVLLAHNAEVSIFNTTFQKNVMSASVGLNAILQFNGNSNVNFTECNFVDNMGQLIRVMGVGTFRKCFFGNNIVLGSGQIITCGSSVNIFDSNFEKNVVQSGILGSLPETNLRIIGTNFISNFIFEKAMLFILSEAFIDRCLFVDNIARSDSIISTVSTDVVIQNSEFQANSGLYGIVFIVEATSVLISNCSFISNKLELNAFGGAMHIYRTSCNIKNSTFNNNVGEGNASSILLSESTLFIDNSVFNNNIAQFGIIEVDQSTAVVTNSKFYTNRANSAGVFYIKQYSQLTVQTSSFQNNSVSGDWFDPNGGVIYCYKCILSIEESTFISNYANNNGGVIWATSAAQVSISSSSFANNGAAKAGATSYFEITNNGSSAIPITYNNCTFTNNSAVYGPEGAGSISSVNINVPDVIYGGKAFPVSVEMVDAYNQVVETAIPLISISILSNGVVVENISDIGYLGQVSYNLNFYGEIGRTYNLVVSTDQLGSYTVQKSLYLHSCEDGDAPSERDPNICIPCRAGTVGWGGACRECPKGGICSGKNSLVAEKGWWIPPRPSPSVPPSPPPKLMHCDPEVCKFNSCRPHHYGVLCGQCESGYSKMRLFCNKCNGADPAKVFFYVLFFVFFGLFLSFFPLPSTKVISSLIFFLNGVAMLGQYNEFFALIPLVQFNVDFWPKGCFANLNFHDKFFIGIIIPLFFVLPLSISLVGNRILSRSPKWSYKILGERSKQVTEASLLQRTISNLIVLVPSLSFFAFHIFPTIKVGSSHSLSVDQTAAVGDSAYHGAVTLASFILVIIFSLLVLSTVAFKSMLMLPIIAMYSSKFQFWETISILRAVSIAIIYSALPFHPHTRTIVIELLCCGFACLYYFCKPFRFSSRNQLEVLLMALLGVCAGVLNSQFINRSPLAVGIILTLLGFGGLILCVLHIKFAKEEDSENMSGSSGVSIALHATSSSSSI